MNVTRYLLAASTIFFAALAGAQAPQQGTGAAPVFHSEAKQVLVDAVVSDKSGKYLTNLSTANFHIFEDGKEQTVRGIIKQSDPQLSSPQYVVLLMDQMPFDQQRWARDTAKIFASHVVGPRRFMALLSYQGKGHISVDLAPSNDLAALTQAIENMKSSGISSGDAVGGEQTVGAKAITTGDYSGSAGTTGTSLNSMKNAAADRGMHDTNADMVNGANDYDVRSLLEALRQLTKTMATLPGRKTIIYLSPGFHTNSDQDRYMSSLITEANRGNVSFYPIQVGFETSLRQPLRAMANETGGFTAGGNNDLAGAFEMIQHDQQQYYMIAYTPANSTPNTCHNLTVKVDVPDSVIRSRKQYCNFHATDPLQGTSTDGDLSAKASGQQSGNISIKMQAPFFYDVSGTGRLSVSAEIPTASLNFVKQNKKLHASLNVLGIAYTPEGEAGARFSETIPFDFETKADVEKFKKENFAYRTEFELPAGVYSLSLVASPDTGNFGKVDIPVRIDAWDGKGLMVSGLALSTNFKEVSTSGGDIDSVLSANHIPLISKGTQFEPSPVTSFHKTESAAIYFEVYEPKLLTATPPRVYVELSIADRKTGKLVVGTGAMYTLKYGWVNPGSATIPVSLSLSQLSQALPAGEYRVYVKAIEPDGTVSVVRSQNFDILP